MQLFASEQVLVVADLAKVSLESGRGARGLEAALRHHHASGLLRRVRRGLYISGPDSADAYLLASKAAPDAVIAYGGALSFHGLTDLGNQVEYLTGTSARRFIYGEVIYQPVRHPRPELEAVSCLHQGRPLQVMPVERALVGVLRWQNLGPLMDEVAKLIVFRPLDVERLIWEALRLGSAPVIGRLGYLLDRRGVHHSTLARLADKVPPRAVPLVTQRPWDPDAMPEQTWTCHFWRVKVPLSLDRSIEAARGEARGSRWPGSR